jgi:DNA-binding transcriptional LysR family regulator
MNLRALQCFVIFAEELNFSRAAERLHVAQPARSQQVRLLEGILGTQLVDRTRRPLRLTAAESYLSTEARQILSSWEQATLGVQEISIGKRGWLSVGFTRSAMYSVLPPALKAFHQANPQVELKLFAILTEDQTDALLDKRIHVGIGRQPAAIAGCTSYPILRERLMVVLAQDHPLAAQKEVHITDLADSPLILYPKHQSAQFKHSVQSIYRDAGVTPFVAHQTDEIQIAVALVAAGLGVTFVGESVSKHGRADVVFRHVAGPGSSHWTTLAATFRSEDMSPHLRSFLAGLPGPLADARL